MPPIVSRNRATAVCLDDLRRMDAPLQKPLRTDASRVRLDVNDVDAILLVRLPLAAHPLVLLDHNTGGEDLM